MFASLFVKLSGILIFIFSVCAAEKTVGQKPKKPKLKIELGQHFQEDDVKIWFDKKLVYNKKLTSADSLQVTDAFEIPKPKKAFTITVAINGEKFEQSSPKHEKEMEKADYSLLINYDREMEEVAIKTKIVIILYD